MELYQVRYFVAVARHLNFTRAAEACHVSQPALTRAVQKLEQDLGGDLIIRERSLTQLTDLGKLVLPSLEQLLAAADAVQTGAKDYLCREVAPLTIGLAPCVSPRVISSFLAHLADIVPGLQVELVELTGPEISCQLLSGALNAAVAGDAEGLCSRIDRLNLYEERFVVLMSPNSPLADRDEVAIEDLSDQVWLERTGCGALGRLWNAVLPGQPGPRVLHRGRQELHLQELVAAGLGVLLCGERAPHPGNLVARPIESDPLVQRVGLHTIAGRRHTPALEALIRLARGYVWSPERERTTRLAVIGRAGARPMIACRAFA